MPPHITSSSDDEDAPEAFSLAQSKRNVKTQDDLLKQFQARERERQKERNRKKDRQLKERASKRKDTTRSAEVEDGMQARMERAMRNAEEEATDEDEGGSESESFEGSEGETSSEGSGSNMEGYEDEEDSVMHSDDDESHAHLDVTSESGANAKTSQANTKRNPQHLPDHLFTSAFTPQTQPSLLKRESLSSPPRKNSARKRTHRTHAKDLIVGYV